MAFGNISDSDKVILDSKLASMSKLLINGYTRLQDKMINISLFDTCNYNIACADEIEDLEISQYFFNDLVNLNETVITNVSSIDTQEAINEICIANTLKDIWIENLNASMDTSNENITGLQYQYYDGESGISVLYPAFTWNNKDECTDYDPRLKPWYVSAVSAQKNIILLIDLSDSSTNNSDTLRRLKYTASLFLNVSSYRDFIGIVTYTEYGRAYLPQMVRATMSNVRILNDYVASLEVVVNSNSNIGSALESAYELLENSITAGSTSLCHNVFVLLSTGTNDMPTVKPLDVIKKYSTLQTMIFSAVYSNATNGVSTLSEISCYTNGNQEFVMTDIDAKNVITHFVNYMSSVIYSLDNNDNVRWSEPYDDEENGSRLISGSLPVYIGSNESRTIYGVVTIDIDIENFLAINPNMTEIDFGNHLIASQECPPLVINDNRLNKACNKGPVTPSPIKQKNPPAIVTGLGGFAFLSVVFALLFIGSPIFLKIKGKMGGCAMSGYVFVFTFLSLWALCVLWINLNSEIIKYESWERTTLQTISLEENAYRCCDYGGCSCSEFNGPTCGERVGLAQEGPCRNGYRCCNRVCVRCNCRPVCYRSCGKRGCFGSCTTVCSSCCTCTNWVNNQLCYSKCYTCWNPVVTKSYNDTNGITRQAKISTSCGKDNYDCLNNFKNSEGPIGKKVNGYYNPFNYGEITYSVQYSGIMAAFIVPVLLIIGIFTGMMTYHLRK